MTITHGGDTTDQLHVLGTGKIPTIQGGPCAQLLETFPNRYPQRPYIVSFAYPEYTSLCPVTGQPDFGTIVVEYIPDMLCVESKSFKMYMFAYRNHQAFMETVANAVLDDMLTALAPLWCRVKGLFAPRGATHIHVFAEEYKNIDDPQKAEAVRRVVTAWRQEQRPHSWDV